MFSIKFNFLKDGLKNFLHLLILLTKIEINTHEFIY